MSTTATPPRVTEAAWSRTVLDLLHLHGWRTWHDTVAWRSDPGWVDLVAVHPRHGVVYLELKAQRGQVTTAQASWHAALAAAGQRVYVLRPSDWLVAKALAAGVGAPVLPARESASET